MKKHYFVVFLLSMIVFSMSVTADPTKKCSLPEYCELYAHRMELLTGFEPSSSYFVFDLNNEIKYVDLSSGSVMVDQKSLDIIEATVIVHAFNATDDENTENVTKFMAAASALEWNAMEERVNILVNPVTEGKNLYFNDFAPTLLEVMNDSSFYDGNEVLIYSRNYDYYVRYEEYGEGEKEHKEIWCNIRARKE